MLVSFTFRAKALTQLAFTYSKLTIETLAMVSFLLALNLFRTCSSNSIINLELPAG